MRIARYTTVTLTLVALSNLFGGCAANVQLPRGAYTSNHACEDDGECASWSAGHCLLNMEWCYNGLCVVKKKIGCT